MRFRDDPRPSPLAGRWYPGDRDELARSVDRYLAGAEAPLPGEVVAVVAPHAGHLYCGAVAGAAFSLVPEDLTTVAVISPLHHHHAAPVLTTAHRAYTTPLGEIEVDRLALKRIHAKVPLATMARDPEHSLEIVLPFLQRRLGEFRLIPLMLGDQSLRVARELADALVPLLGGPALLVASSDLSHFHPQREAEKLDRYMLKQIAAGDAAGVLAAEEDGRGFACGKGAIATVLLAARQLGGNRVKVVAYATSGDVTGDLSSVVGYGAAVITREAV